MRYGCLVSFTDANWDRLYSRLCASAQHTRAALADTHQVAVSSELCRHGRAAIELRRRAAVAEHQFRNQSADFTISRLLGLSAHGAGNGGRKCAKEKTPVTAFF